MPLLVDFHRTLLTHALALSASQIGARELPTKKKKNIRVSMHSGRLELTQLTWVYLVHCIISRRQGPPSTHTTHRLNSKVAHSPTQLANTFVEWVVRYVASPYLWSRPLAPLAILLATVAATAMAGLSALDTRRPAASTIAKLHILAKGWKHTQTHKTQTQKRKTKAPNVEA